MRKLSRRTLLSECQKYQEQSHFFTIRRHPFGVQTVGYVDSWLLDLSCRPIQTNYVTYCMCMSYVYVFVKLVKQRCIFAAEKRAKFCSFFRFVPWKIRKLSAQASTLPNTSRWWFDFEKNEIKVDNAEHENFWSSIEIFKKKLSKKKIEKMKWKKSNKLN